VIMVPADQKPAGCNGTMLSQAAQCTRLYLVRMILIIAGDVAVLRLRD